MNITWSSRWFLSFCMYVNASPRYTKVIITAANMCRLSVNLLVSPAIQILIEQRPCNLKWISEFATCSSFCGKKKRANLKMF